MPVNRNALIRYKTLDKCLQNRYRQWTLDDLIDACSDALYDYEGIDKGVSKRSVQADIQMMRSDKLGYNAPIVVVDRKYYTYEDPNYSITNIPLTDQDLGMLGEAVEFMKQFQGFSHFRELDSMVQKLEDHIYSQKTHTQPVIDFEKNENLKGLEYLDVLYQAIVKRKALTLTYQSFKARQANSFVFHPFLLKEFRNRWFLIGTKEEQEMLLNLALDRIIKIDESKAIYRPKPDFDSTTYFKDAIGVSISPNLAPEEVILHVSRNHAPYVLTKPFHHSQKLLEKDHYGITIGLQVQHNFELEKEILGFGEGIQVLAPPRLKRTIRERLNAAIDLYQTEMSEKGLATAQQRMSQNGFAILNHVYTKREIRNIGKVLDQSLKRAGEPVFAHRQLLNDFPDLGTHLFNKNVQSIVQSMDPNAVLTKAIYFDKPAASNWYVTWHQDLTVNLKEKKAHKDFKAWTQKDGMVSAQPPEAISQATFALRIHLDDCQEANGALKVVPGSQNKRLSDEEIQLITNNSMPFVCEVQAGGVQLMRPLLLHASSKSINQKRRRVIHLEFCSATLPKGLGWAEEYSWE